jgi:hypothetical protein
MPRRRELGDRIQIRLDVPIVLSESDASVAHPHSGARDALSRIESDGLRDRAVCRFRVYGDAHWVSIFCPTIG